MIRIAKPEDAADILAIYGPVVRDTVISFEIEPPTAAEMAERVASTLRTYPWLVWEEGGRAVGYVYAGRHAARAAYRWSAEVTAYVAPEVRRRGLGRTLYGALFDILRRQGFHAVFAGVTLPNDASVALHEAVGMRPVGVYPETGFKFGAWRDVGWWGMTLDAGAAPGGEPIPFSALADPLRGVA